MNSCRKIGGYFFLFFSIALIVQAKPVIIESSIAPLIASFIPAPKKKTINATITIRMIEIIASHNISPSSPIFKSINTKHFSILLKNTKTTLKCSSSNVSLTCLPTNV